MNKAKNRKSVFFWATVAVAALAAAALVGFLIAQGVKPSAVTRADSGSYQMADEEGFGNTVSLDGVTYTEKPNLTSVLFLGIDHAQDPDSTVTVGTGGRSDAMFLLVMDSGTKTMQILEISRDTMVDVDIYDAQDTFLYSSRMQITMQYACGSSARRSCWLTKNKVSELLYGVPVSYTAALSMDGIASVVDALGGITITIPEDYTNIDPLLVKGKTVTLNGEQAVRYIRYRDTAVTGSNDSRMERQTQLLRAVAAQLKAGNSTQEITTIQAAAGDYLQSDLDADTLQKLSTYTLDDNILKVPGETRAGEQHDEYYVDDDALRRMIIQLFYRPAE